MGPASFAWLWHRLEAVTSAWRSFSSRTSSSRILNLLGSLRYAFKASDVAIPPSTTPSSLQLPNLSSKTSSLNGTPLYSLTRPFSDLFLILAFFTLVFLVPVFQVCSSCPLTITLYSCAIIVSSFLLNFTESLVHLLLALFLSA